MSLQNLDNLVQRGLLHKEPPHKDEISRLLAAADASLADSRVEAVSLASRFAMAYQAALGYSLIALRVRGYRTSSNQPGQHSIAIQSLPLTIGFSQADTNTLNSFKEKRHRGAYEGILTSSEKELAELQALAATLRATALAWVKQNRADLI
jgi:hypothetical protein